jgi:hypothetical protein
MRQRSALSIRTLATGEFVVKRIGCALVVLGMTTVYGTAFASDVGTEQEARAMLDRAIAALKEDETAALAAFTAGEPGFKDRDLYVFCVGPDGVVTANGGHVSAGREQRARAQERADQPGRGPDLRRRLLRPVMRCG